MDKRKPDIWRQVGELVCGHEVKVIKVEPHTEAKGASSDRAIPFLRCGNSIVDGHAILTAEGLKDEVFRCLAAPVVPAPLGVQGQHLQWGLCGFG